MRNMSEDLSNTGITKLDGSIERHIEYAGMVVSVELSNMELLNMHPVYMMPLDEVVGQVYMSLTLDNGIDYNHTITHNNLRIPLDISPPYSIDSIKDQLKIRITQGIDDIMSVLDTYKFMILRHAFNRSSDDEYNIISIAHGQNMDGFNELIEISTLGRSISVLFDHLVEVMVGRVNTNLTEDQLGLIRYTDLYITNRIKRDKYYKVSLSGNGAKFMRLLLGLIQSNTPVDIAAAMDMLMIPCLDIGIDRWPKLTALKLLPIVPIMISFLSQDDLEELGRKASLIRIDIVSETL